jgi:sphinganine-1-phosphate aldolase
MSVGHDRYIGSCVRIVGTAKSIEHVVFTSSVRSSESAILREPLVSVVALSVHYLNIYDIADNMAVKGWHPNVLHDPPAINIAVTMPVSKAAERLIKDPEQTVNEERNKEKKQLESARPPRGRPLGTWLRSTEPLDRFLRRVPL